MKSKLAKVFLVMGILCIAGAILLAGYTLYSSVRAEQRSEALLNSLEEQISPADMNMIPDYLLNPDMEMPTVEIEGVSCIGMLEIPSANQKLPVISEWDYYAMNAGPCRYAGSAYQDNLVIAGHNNRAHFGCLHQMELEDLVILTDAKGNQFQYRVACIEMLEPTEVKEMKSGDWDLTLFTCNFAITHRLAIRCEKIYTN